MTEHDLEELADELGFSPEALQKLLAVVEQRTAKKFPVMAEHHARDQQTRKREEQTLRNEYVTEALHMVSRTIPGMHPERGDDGLQRRVAKELEADEDLRYIVGTIEDTRAIAGALRLAAKKVLDSESKSPKPKPAAAVRTPTAGEEEGPMTIQRSIRDAKAKYAAGDIV